MPKSVQSTAGSGRASCGRSARVALTSASDAGTALFQLSDLHAGHQAFDSGSAPTAAKHSRRRELLLLPPDFTCLVPLSRNAARHTRRESTQQVASLTEVPWLALEGIAPSPHPREVHGGC